MYRPADAPGSSQAEAARPGTDARAPEDEDGTNEEVMTARDTDVSPGETAGPGTPSSGGGGVGVVRRASGSVWSSGGDHGAAGASVGGRGGWPGGGGPGSAVNGSDGTDTDEEMRATHACLDIPVDEEVWSGSISSSGQTVEVAVEPGDSYYLVTQGTIRFSETGVQDGLRRWHDEHESCEPFCVGCDPLLQSIALTVDDSQPSWLQECPLQHTHVFLTRATGRVLSLRLGDKCLWCSDPYADNAGELSAWLYRANGADELVARDANGRRLGVDVGQAHVTHTLGLRTESAQGVCYGPNDASGDASDYIRAVGWHAGAEDVHIVEITGSAVSVGGVEVDYLSQFDHPQARITAIDPLVEFECEDWTLLRYDRGAHRAVAKLAGCGQPVVARLADEYGDLKGQIRLTLFAPP